MKGGVPPTPRRPGTPSQFEVAKQMLMLGESMRPAATASFVPIVPAKYEGKVKGLGGRKRKTKKARRVRRTTRRGGMDLDPNHVGVQMAEALVGRNPPPFAPPRRIASAPPALGTSPSQMIFNKLTRELGLTEGQITYMHRVYADALNTGIQMTEDSLRRHLKNKFKL